MNKRRLLLQWYYVKQYKYQVIAVFPIVIASYGLINWLLKFEANMKVNGNILSLNHVPTEMLQLIMVHHVNT